MGPPPRHSHLLLGPRTRPPSRRNPPSLAHPNAARDKSKSSHRFWAPPLPHRPERLPPQTPPRKRFQQRKPSFHRRQVPSNVPARMPGQRHLRHDPLRQTLLLRLFEGARRRRRAAEGSYYSSAGVEADDVEGSERFGCSAGEFFGRAAAGWSFDRSTALEEEEPEQQYQ